MTSPPRSWSKITLGVLAGLGVAGCFWIAWPFLSAIITALMAGIALSPLHQRIEAKVNQRGRSALLVLLIFTVAVVIPAVLLALAIGRELQALVAAQPTGERLPWLDGLAAKVGMSGDEVWQWAEEQVRQSARSLLGTAAGLATGIGNALLTAAVTLFTIFFVLRDGDAWRRRVIAVLPLEAAQTRRLMEVARQTIVANVYGLLAVALAQGLTAGIGFALAGVKSPILWAAVTAVFSILPLVGSAIVWVPAVIWLFAAGKTGTAFFLLIWSATLVSYSDNVVRPFVISDQMKINPLFIFFALLGGAQVFGFTGLLLGPVIVAVTGAVLRMLWEEFTTEAVA